MTPVDALERVVHCLDRAHDTGFKAKAFVRALDVVRALPADEVVERAEAGTLTELDGIGDSSATVIRQAIAGESTYLDTLEQKTRVSITPEGQQYRSALKGDLHLHSRWSDGGATIEAMARTAIALGHEYMVLTDHSPRLTVAHGLSRRAPGVADRRRGRTERPPRPVPHPHRHRGRHPRGRHARPLRRGARPARRGRRQRAQQAADGRARR